MVGSHSIDLGQSTHGFSWKRKEWLGFGLSDCHVEFIERMRAVLHCAGSFSPGSSWHWWSPITASPLPSTSHRPLSSQSLSHSLPSKPTSTSNMAATSSLLSQVREHGQLKDGVGKRCLCKYSSLGIHVQSTPQTPKCTLELLHFLVEVVVLHFPRQLISLEKQY